MMAFAIDLHTDFVHMPFSLADRAHGLDAFPSDLVGKNWPEPVPSIAHCLVADVDPAFVEHVFDVAQGQRKPDIHHHCDADHLGKRLKVAGRVAISPWDRAGEAGLPNKPFALTISLDGEGTQRWGRTPLPLTMPLLQYSTNQFERTQNTFNLFRVTKVL